jgi:uncharacterized membrane protein YgcG
MGSDLPAESSLSLRASLVCVGGAKPAARFESHSEDRPFTLNLSIKFAQEIGRYLYRDLDIVARVHRDADGVIEYGQLQEFIPVTNDDATANWRDWYRDYASEWDKAKDIEAALGRGGDGGGGGGGDGGGGGGGEGGGGGGGVAPQVETVGGDDDACE